MNNDIETKSKRVSSLTIGFLLSVLCAAIFLLGFWDQPINHDTAWFLIATRQWLEGAQLYVDVIEVNPPLNFYYTLPAILLANLSGLTDTNAQYVVLAVLLTVSLFWSWCIIERNVDLSLLRRGLLLIAIAAAITLPAIFTIGQREHIMCLLILPWITGLITMEGANQGWGGAGRGAYAALGICLKPFFLVFPLFVVIWMVLKSKSLKQVFSAAYLAMGGVGLIYIALAAMIHPEYFTKIIPLAQTVYGDYDITLAMMLSRLDRSLISFALLLIILGWVYRKQLKSLPIFMSLILASLASYFLQWTSFWYHSLPLYIWLSVFTAWLLIGNFGTLLTRVAALIASLWIVVMFLRIGPYSNQKANVIVEAIASQQKSPVIVSYTTFVSTGPLLALQLDGTWASHYPALWSTPAITTAWRDGECSAKAERCAALKDEEIIMRENIFNDLRHWRPNVIVFDTKPGYIRNPNFSFRPFLMRDERFAQEFAQFKHYKTVDHYEIWIR